MRSRALTDGHVALGLIRDGEGRAMPLLAARGVDAGQLREEIRLALAS